MEILLLVLKSVGAIAAPVKWIKSWIDKRRNRHEDNAMSALQIWLARNIREGKGDVLRTEIGSDLYLLAEKMVSKQLFERVLGVPGFYTLPGRIRIR